MLIVKIGGGEKINLEGIVKGLASLKERFVVVHGANHARDELARRLGAEKKILTSASGYDSVYSDEQAIDLLMMAYAGLKNKRLVELCHRNGLNAVGLTGLDARLIQGKRNAGIRVKDGEKLKIVRDFSGKPQSVNKEFLELLMGNGYAPVLCVPIIDENGYAINSENDDIVRVLQKELKAGTVINLIEEKGFLKEKDDKDSLIHHLSLNELKAWEEKSTGRVKRKLLSVRQLLEASPCRVIIGDGRTENPVKDALEGKGTIIE